MAALRYYGGGVDAELRDFLDHHLAAGAASADLLHAAVGAADEKVRLHVVYVLTKYHRLSAAVRADSAVRATGDNGAVDGALARFVDSMQSALAVVLILIAAKILAETMGYEVPLGYFIGAITLWRVVATLVALYRVSRKRCTDAAR